MNIEDKAKELRREYQREYMRKWRKKNPEKIKEINERYWINRAKEQLKKENENV